MYRQSTFLFLFKWKTVQKINNNRKKILQNQKMNSFNKKNVCMRAKAHTNLLKIYTEKKKQQRLLCCFSSVTKDFIDLTVSLFLKIFFGVFVCLYNYKFGVFMMGFIIRAFCNVHALSLSDFLTCYFFFCKHFSSWKEFFLYKVTQISLFESYLDIRATSWNFLI